MNSAGLSGKSGLALVINPPVIAGLIAFLTPICVLYVPLSLAVILPVGAAILLVCRLATGRPKLYFDSLPSGAILGMLAVIVLSMLWSYAAELTFDKLPRTAVAVFAGILFIAAVKGLDDRASRMFSRCFLASMLLVFILIVIEKLSGGMLLRYSDAEGATVQFLNQFNRPLSILSVLIWPVVVILARRHWGLAIAALGIYLACLLFFINGSAFAAIGVGAFVFAVVYMLPKIGPLIVGITLAATVVAAPTIDHYLPASKTLFEELNLPRSTYHRLLIWDFTTERIAERPVLGWGFNASRALPGGQKNLDVSEPALPLHPHNAALQWRVELGILGVLFGAAIILAATEMARRYAAGRVARAGAFAVIGATFVIAMISFGAWQTWWISGMFLIAGFTTLVCRRRLPE
jgi:exopolysaccharide production protein ExoQ